MKKTNVTKQLNLNKVTIAGLNNAGKAGVIGGAPDTSVERNTCFNCTTDIMTNISKVCGGSIYPITSEPTDPTYTC
ncbi:MAG: hypothetical protein GY765_33525 [bacterium]|nr:hypothetical protein [bacterium]